MTMRVLAILALIFMLGQAIYRHEIQLAFAYGLALCYACEAASLKDEANRRKR